MYTSIVMQKRKLELIDIIRKLSSVDRSISNDVLNKEVEKLLNAEFEAIKNFVRILNRKYGTSIDPDSAVKDYTHLLFEDSIADIVEFIMTFSEETKK